LLIISTQKFVVSRTACSTHNPIRNFWLLFLLLLGFYTWKDSWKHFSEHSPSVWHPAIKLEHKRTLPFISQTFSTSSPGSQIRDSNWNRASMAKYNQHAICWMKVNRILLQ